MKLHVQTTRIVTTDDLRLFCEPPLRFQAKGYFSPVLSKDLGEWENSYDGERAAELISKIFISVSQEGQSYPLTTKSDVLAFRDAIEETNPGGGNDFLVTLLESYLTDHFRFFQKRLLALENSLQESGNGKVKESTK